MHKRQLQTPFSTRQFMYSEDFEIYYYNDMPISAVSPHAHDYYEFYFFLEGKVDIHVDDKVYSIHKGDFLIIPPHVTHYPVFKDDTTPYRRFILWISTAYCKSLVESSPDFGFLFQHVATTSNYSFSNDIVTFNHIQSQIFELIEEVKSSRFGRSAAISLKLNFLLLYLNRLIYEKNHIANTSETKELHTSLCDFISSHLDEDLSLERLEREFFVSKYYISHTFKDNMGLSIHRYITKKRLQACQSAISSGSNISEIFELYGFGDYSSFYRAFKKEYGLSPKEFRLTTLTSEINP